MSDTKYRIAGYDSMLAKQNPEVADAIDTAGKVLFSTLNDASFFTLNGAISA